MAFVSEDEDVLDMGSAYKRLRKPRLSGLVSLDDDISVQIQKLVHI
jgi:hypothetical protein